MGIDLGMTGFDGRGWYRIASREAPTSRNQRKNKVPIAQLILLCPSLHSEVLSELAS